MIERRPTLEELNVSIEQSKKKVRVSTVRYGETLTLTIRTGDAHRTKQELLSLMYTMIDRAREWSPEPKDDL